MHINPDLLAALAEPLGEQGVCVDLNQGSGPVPALWCVCVCVYVCVCVCVRERVTLSTVDGFLCARVSIRAGDLRWWAHREDVHHG